MQRLALAAALVALLSGCGAQLTVLKSLDDTAVAFLATTTAIRVYDAANFPPPEGKPRPQATHLVDALRAKGYNAALVSPTLAPRGSSFDKAFVKAHRREWIAPNEALLVVNFLFSSTTETEEVQQAWNSVGADGQIETTWTTEEVQVTVDYSEAAIRLYRNDDALIYKAVASETAGSPEWGDVIGAVLEAIPRKGSR